jgi:hypothetical protein
LIDFLERLQLYDIETLPADIDGNGVIQKNFVVVGKNTGRERFNAEWLFETPAEIQGNVTNVQGIGIRSFAVENLVEAYGLDLPLRQDSDLDGWPDVWDAAPNTPGFGDGQQRNEVTFENAGGLGIASRVGIHMSKPETPQQRIAVLART